MENYIFFGQIKYFYGPCSIANEQITTGQPFFGGGVVGGPTSHGACRGTVAQLGAAKDRERSRAAQSRARRAAGP